MRRLLSPWLLSLAVLVLSATAASAAGSIGPFQVFNWGVGHDSEGWRNNSNSTSATVSARICRDEISNGSNDWITVKIWRNAGVFPPEDQGSKTLDCYGTSFVSKTWGASSPNMTGPEDFHFQLVNYSGGTGGGNVVDFTYKVAWN